MKLTLAIGLLANAIPVLTEPITGRENEKLQITNLLQGTKLTANRRSLNAERKLRWKENKRLKNAPSVPSGNVLLCNPTSTNADTGILSCGENSVCVPALWSELGGVCTRAILTKDDGHGSDREETDLMKSSLVRKECDPASVDVGILGCNEGEFCKVVDHYASPFGGICVPSEFTSRQLNTVDDYLSLCDPSHEDYQSTCDCSTWNITGTISCVYEYENFDMLFPGCDDISLSITLTYAFEDRTLTSFTGCYDFTAPYAQKTCITSIFPDGATSPESCSISFNDGDCNSCVSTYDFYDFDCSNIDGGPVGSSAVELSPIIGRCYTVSTGNYTCTSLCTAGYFIPESKYDVNLTIPDYGPASCGYLAYSAAYALIPDSLCTMFSTAAQSDCCESSGPTTEPPEGAEPVEEEDEDPVNPDAAEDGAAALLSFHGKLTLTGFVMVAILLFGN